MKGGAGFDEGKGHGRACEHHQTLLNVVDRQPSRFDGCLIEGADARGHGKERRMARDLSSEVLGGISWKSYCWRRKLVSLSLMRLTNWVS